MNIYGLPLYYIIYLIIVIKVRPYLEKKLNIIGIFLQASNLFFSLLPIFFYYNIKIPDIVISIFAIVSLVLPIISIIILFCAKRSVQEQIGENLTELPPLSPEDIIRRLHRIREMGGQAFKKNYSKSNDTYLEETVFDISQESSQYESNDLESVSDGNVFNFFQSSRNSDEGSQDIQASEINSEDQEISSSQEISSGQEMNSENEVISSTVNKNGRYTKKSQTKKDDEKKEDEKNEKEEEEDEDEEDDQNLLQQLEKYNFPEDRVKVPQYLVCSISDFIKKNEGRHLLIHEDREYGYFKFNKRFFAARMSRCYDMISRLLDGTTITFVIKAVHTFVLIAGIGIGWYYGGITFANQSLQQIDC